MRGEYLLSVNRETYEHGMDIKEATVAIDLALDEVQLHSLTDVVKVRLQKDAGSGAVSSEVLFDPSAFSVLREKVDQVLAEGLEETELLELEEHINERLAKLCSKSSMLIDP